MKGSSIPRTQEEALGSNPWRDGKKTLRVLFVFVSCNLVLALTKAHCHLSADPWAVKQPTPATFHRDVRPWVGPVGFLLSRVSTVAMAYLSAVACCGDGRALEETISRARQTWKRLAATLLYVELLATTFSSFLWTLSALARATRGATSEVLFISALTALAVWLVSMLFTHSEIASN